MRDSTLQTQIEDDNTIFTFSAGTIRASFWLRSVVFIERGVQVFKTLLGIFTLMLRQLNSNNIEEIHVYMEGKNQFFQKLIWPVSIC